VWSGPQTERSKPHGPMPLQPSWPKRSSDHRLEHHMALQARMLVLHAGLAAMRPCLEGSLVVPSATRLTPTCTSNTRPSLSMYGTVTGRCSLALMPGVVASCGRCPCGTHARWREGHSVRSAPWRRWWHPQGTATSRGKTRNSVEGNRMGTAGCHRCMLRLVQHKVKSHRGTE